MNARAEYMPMPPGAVSGIVFAMPADRLARQIAFIVEIDKLKHVLRRSLTGLARQRRLENSAEHSWHFALAAMLLAEYADAPIDLLRVLKMALVHDLVEIDAGDTYCYDARAALDKDAREQAAAERIFALLPQDQATELRQLWDEFEARATPESRFASGIDRLQPVLLNYFSKGEAWRANRVDRERVIERNQPIADGSRTLWNYIRSLIDDAVEKGYLPP
jgi:putative hydrolase of HD superfamily